MKQFPIALIVERAVLDNRWASEKWEVVGVVPDFSPSAPASPQPLRQIVEDPERTLYRVDGFALELFRDEAENYFLNMSTERPAVFVMWRMEEEMACPKVATVSYGEAARFLDSGEQVDAVPMPREIADWVGDFVNTHYTPAPRKKIRRNDPFAQGEQGQGRKDRS